MITDTPKFLATSILEYEPLPPEFLAITNSILCFSNNAVSFLIVNGPLEILIE